MQELPSKSYHLAITPNRFVWHTRSSQSLNGAADQMTKFQAQQDCKISDGVYCNNTVLSNGAKHNKDMNVCSV